MIKIKNKFILCGINSNSIHLTTKQIYYQIKNLNQFQFNRIGW